MTKIEGLVRLATVRDVDSLLAFDRNETVNHGREPLLVARVQSGEVILFERQDRLLGYLVVRSKLFFGRDFVELLVVSTNDRRQRVGSGLLHHAVGLSSTNRIFTSTNQSNTPMIGLLEKLGWTFSGQLEGIDEGDPELVYYKETA
jgi:ribosomal protein S18 acetylase RimI-like enzyme